MPFFLTCPYFKPAIMSQDQTNMQGTDTHKFFLRLAVVSMAGLAAEGLEYDKVVGQSADLFTLQVL